MIENSKPNKSMPYFEKAKYTLFIDNNGMKTSYIETREAAIISQTFSDDVLKSFVDYISDRYKMIKKDTLLSEIKWFKETFNNV
jgi:hypothetical protein